MQLFNPSAAQEQSDQTTRDILRIQEVKELLKSEEMKLSKSQADFQHMLATQRLRYAEEEKEHEQRKSEMKAEIAELEKKKLNALVPVDVLEMSAKEKNEEADKYLDSLHQREEDVEELKEKLEEKLSEVEQRESDVSIAEQKMKLEREGLEKQKEISIIQTKQMSEEMIGFQALKDKTVKEISETKKKLEMVLLSLDAKAEKIKIQEEELNKLSIRLRDERGVLDRAFAEVKRLKDKYNKNV